MRIRASGRKQSTKSSNDMGKLNTRQEFYDAVCAEARKGSLTMCDAYVIVAAQYLKSHGEDRYVSFDAFYQSNWRAMVMEQKQRIKDAMVRNELYAIFEQHETGQIKGFEAVEIISKKLSKKKTQHR